MPKTLTREQNLIMRLNTARGQAERALLEAFQNRYETGSSGFDTTIQLLAEMVAMMRLENTVDVYETGKNLIVEYNRAVSLRKEKTAEILTDFRRALNVGDQYKRDNSQILDSLNIKLRHESWTVANTPVEFPSFPHPSTNL